MDFVQLGGFTVVGIELRTSNAREMTSDGIIPRQWERITAESLRDRIPSRVDSDLIAVYSDYATDEHGEYNFLLGARVAEPAAVPAGMILRQVPEGRYAVFTSEPGPAARVVYETWKRIWAEPRTASFTRSYRADFEVYQERAVSPADSRVRIYIGVQP